MIPFPKATDQTPEEITESLVNGPLSVVNRDKLRKALMEKDLQIKRLTDKCDRLERQIETLNLVIRRGEKGYQGTDAKKTP